MTSIKFRWPNTYDLGILTRDSGLAFFTEGSDHQLYSLVVRKQAGQEKWLKLDLYLGHYRGLSRSLVSFEIEISEESFISRMQEQGKTFEVFVGETQDYFERRRPVEFRWAEISSSSLKDSFAS